MHVGGNEDMPSDRKNENSYLTIYQHIDLLLARRDK